MEGTNGISETVQVMEFLGRGMGGMARGVRFLVQSGVKIHNWNDAKHVQHMIKQFCADKGRYSTLSMADMIKITGGNYSILNIPTEDGKEISKLSQALKKAGVPFSEMKDLNLGDGYTQLAYNPQDAEKMKAVCEAFTFASNKKPQEMGWEDYEKNANPQEMEKFTKETTEKLEKEEDKELSNNGKKKDEVKGKDKTELEDMVKSQEMVKKNNNPDYMSITINKNSLLLKETADKYITRVPGSYNKATGEYLVLAVNKSACNTKGDTIFTHLKTNSANSVYRCNEKNPGVLSQVKTEESLGVILCAKFYDKPQKSKSKTQSTMSETSVVADGVKTVTTTTTKTMKK